MLERVRHEENEKDVEEAEAGAPQRLQAAFDVEFAPREVEKRRDGEEVEADARQQNHAVVEDFRQVDEHVVVRPAEHVENPEEYRPKPVIGENVRPVTGSRHFETF